MIGEQLLSSRPITLVRVKNILMNKKKLKELNYEQDLTSKYATSFSKLTKRETKSLMKELKGISSLDREMRVKITDLLPQSMEILKLLVLKDSKVPEADLQQALEISQKYKK